jgi:hypothetical protein
MCCAFVIKLSHRPATSSIGQPIDQRTEVIWLARAALSVDSFSNSADLTLPRLVERALL